MRLTSRRSQPPLALSVPLSRFTSQVGGGSAFYVRHHIVRLKYTTAVCGCLAHAIAVTASLFGYCRSGANVPDASLSMPVFICVVLVLAIIWPLWCMVIWHSASKDRTLATVVQ